jgi:hypothetical protein
VDARDGGRPVVSRGLHGQGRRGLPPSPNFSFPLQYYGRTGMRVKVLREGRVQREAHRKASAAFRRRHQVGAGYRDSATWRGTRRDGFASGRVGAGGNRFQTTESPCLRLGGGKFRSISSKSSAVR